MWKVTKCTGEGQGSCTRCTENGKWNRTWMCFLNKIEGLDGCYCNDCTKELVKHLEQFIPREMKNVICVNCRKHVEYELKCVKVKTFVEGEEVVYNQVIAHCKECGVEVWAEEVDDLNSIAPIVANCNDCTKELKKKYTEEQQ